MHLLSLSFWHIVSYLYALTRRFKSTIRNWVQQIRPHAILQKQLHHLHLSSQEQKFKTNQLDYPRTHQLPGNQQNVLQYNDLRSVLRSAILRACQQSQRQASTARHKKHNAIRYKASLYWHHRQLSISSIQNRGQASINWQATFQKTA